MLQTMNIWGTAMWMIFFMTVFLPKKGSGYIIGTYEDYLKLHPNEKYANYSKTEQKILYLEW